MALSLEFILRLEQIKWSGSNDIIYTIEISLNEINSSKTFCFLHVLTIALLQPDLYHFKKSYGVT